MNISAPRPALDQNDIGREMYHLITELYPICRSITGNGVRETLRIIEKEIPLEIHNVPTGTQVFDWTVPREWNITDAYVKNSRGERVIDFQTSNLHVVNYSVPVKKRMSLAELRPHLFTLPDFPNWIPYRNSYYRETWGFCLSHKQLSQLTEDSYEVCIDASLEDGAVTYGEYYIPGQVSEEILLSCHVCHPSLCNDNLSGIALIALLAKYLGSLSLRYSHRFLFIPTTIGAITWLSRNQDNVFRIKHGLVAACVGDPGKSTYKKSRRSNAEIDRVIGHVLKHSGADYEILDFSPHGYDERQFCSPGFNLPMGCLMRTPNGKFTEYHTSADNLEFVQPPYLADSFSKFWSALYILENNRCYLNQNPKCEPHLGKRGLYRQFGDPADGGIDVLAVLWVLNLSDGHHTLLDIADRSGFEFDSIKKASDVLVEHGLLRETKGALPEVSR